MKVPAGMTESQVIELVYEIANRYARKFAFGYYDEDDIRQEAVVMALEAIERSYDGRRPLENFLHVHVGNRLMNLKRDKLIRNDFPCVLCHEGGVHEDGERCKAYKSWLRRNQAKASLMQPGELVGERWDRSCVEEDVETRELIALVDAELPVEMRSDWLRLRAGDKSLSKPVRERIEEEVRRILDGEEEGWSVD